MERLNPTTKRALKAREIHQKTYIGTVVAGVIIGFACIMLVGLGLHWLGWDDMGEYIGVFGVIFIMPALTMAQNRATRALHQSGLLREEIETIVRTGAIAEGEPLEMRESTLWARSVTLAVFAVFMLLFAWLIANSLDNPFRLGIGALAIIAFGAMVLLMAFNIKRPELLVNDDGIADCQNWVAIQFIHWDSIAVMERQRVWGLPPNYSFEAEPTETITLKDAAGKPILTLPAGTPALPISLSKERFIAEIERRLRGDKAADSDG